MSELKRIAGKDRRESFSQLNLPLQEPSCSAVSRKHSRCSPNDIGVTFKDSLRQGPFGWYPYVEGFSANYIKSVLTEFSPKNVFDPFGGSGTTCLAAAKFGIESWYSELNPFMRFVADTKVNGLREASLQKAEFRRICNAFVTELSKASFSDDSAAVDLGQYFDAFPDRDFFVESDVKDLLLCLKLADQIAASQPYAKAILRLAIAANVVKSSNMTRRADLRRRRPDEYKNRSVNVNKFVVETILGFLEDIESCNDDLAKTHFVSEDARSIPEDFYGSFDCALTSPPYLNGTNYFRNTKLELWLLGFIASEKELTSFTSRSVAGGINSVRKTQVIPFRSFHFVEEVAAQLESGEGDRRIPHLVRQYFSDMFSVFVSTRKSLTKSGVLVLDIGDSKFYGVHVPTDQLLIKVAREAGFQLVEERILAKRYSRDKSLLKQVEIIFSNDA